MFSESKVASTEIDQTLDEDFLISFPSYTPAQQWHKASDVAAVGVVLAEQRVVVLQNALQNNKLACQELLLFFSAFNSSIGHPLCAKNEQERNKKQ